MKKNRVINSIVAILTVLSLIGGIFVGIDLMSSNDVANAATATVGDIAWNYTVSSTYADNVYTTQAGLKGEIVIPEEINGYVVRSLGGNSETTPCIPAGSTVTAVKAPLSVTKVNSYAFKGATGMKKFSVYDDTGEEVAMENANIASIGANAFAGDTALENVSTKENEAIGESAFSGCTAIKSVILSDGVTTGKQAFKGCTGLKTALIGNKVTLGDNAFTGDKSITSLVIGNNDVIGASAFENCTSINTVFIPGTTNLGSYAFKGCTGLKNIEVAIETIGNQFDNCPALENIVLDDTVKKVEYYAFNVTNTTAKKVNDDTALVNYVKDGTLESNRGKSGLKTSTVTRNIYCKNPETVFGFMNECRETNYQISDVNNIEKITDSVNGTLTLKKETLYAQKIYITPYNSNTSNSYIRLFNAPVERSKDAVYDKGDVLVGKRHYYSSDDDTTYRGINSIGKYVFSQNEYNILSSGTYTGTKNDTTNETMYYFPNKVNQLYARVSSSDPTKIVELAYSNDYLDYAGPFILRYNNFGASIKTNNESVELKTVNQTNATYLKQGNDTEYETVLFSFLPTQKGIFIDPERLRSENDISITYKSNYEYSNTLSSVLPTFNENTSKSNEAKKIADRFASEREETTMEISGRTFGTKYTANNWVNLDYNGDYSICIDRYGTQAISLNKKNNFTTTIKDKNDIAITISQPYYDDLYYYPNTASGQIAPIRIYTPKGSTATTTTQQTVTNKDNSTTYVTAEKMADALSKTNFSNFVNDYVQLDKTIEKEDMPCYQPEGSIDYTLTKITAAYDGIAFAEREIDYDKVKVTLRTDPAKKIPDVITASDPRVYIISPEDLNKVKIWKDGKNAYEAWPDKASQFPESTFDYNKFDFRIWQGFTHVLDDEDENSIVNCFPGMNTIYTDKIPEGQMTTETKAYIFYVAGFEKIGKSARNMKLADGTVMALSDYNDEYGTDYREAPYKEDGTWVGFGGEYSDEFGSEYSQKDGEWAPIIYKCEISIPTVPSTPNETYVATLNKAYLEDHADEIGWNIEKQAFAVSDDNPVTITKDMILAQVIINDAAKPLANNKFNIDKTTVTGLTDNVVTVTFTGEDNAVLTVSIPVYNTDLEEVSELFDVESIKGLKNSIESLVDEYETACDNLTSYNNIVAAIEKQLTGEDLTEEEQASLESTVAVSNEKIEAIKNEITSLKTTLTTKMAELDTAKQQVLDLSSTKTKNEARIKELETAVTEANGVVDGLKTEKADLEATIEIKLEQIIELTTKKDELEGTISSLNGDIAEMDTVIDTLRTKAAEMQTSISTLETNNEQLGEEVINLNKDIDSLNTTIDNLENSVITKEQAIVELNETVNEMQTSITNLENIKKSNEEEISNLNGTVSDQSLEIQALTKKSDDAKKEIEKLEDENKAIAKVLSEIVNEMNDGDKTLDADNIPVLVTELKNKVKELEEKSIDGINTTTAEKLEKSGYKKASMDETIDGLMTTIEQKNSEISRLKSSGSGSSTPSVRTEYVYVDNGASQETKTTIDNLTTTNESLKTENENLTSENYALAYKVTNLANSNEDLKTKNETLTQKKKDLTAEKKALAAEKKSLEKSNKELETLNNALTTQLNETKTKLTSTESENQKLRDENKRLQTGIIATNTNPSTGSGSTGSGAGGGTTVKPVSPTDQTSKSETDSSEPDEPEEPDEPLHFDTYNTKTYKDIPDASVIMTVFETGIDYTNNVHYIAPENPILSELQQNDISAVNQALSYYAQNKGVLATMVPGGSDIIATLNAPQTEVGFEPITGARIEAEEDQSGMNTVTIESEKFVAGNNYMIVHHSESRGEYDILALLANNDGVISFQLKDLSPITVSEIVTSEISVAPTSGEENTDNTSDTTDGPQPIDVDSVSEDGTEVDDSSSTSNLGLIIIIVCAVVAIGAIVFLLMKKKSGTSSKETTKSGEPTCTSNETQTVEDDDEDDV